MVEKVVEFEKVVVPWLQGQSEETQISRRDFWMEQDRRRFAQGAIRRTCEGQSANDLYFRGLQFDAHGDHLWLAFVVLVGRNPP